MSDTIYESALVLLHQFAGDFCADAQYRRTFDCAGRVQDRQLTGWARDATKWCVGSILSEIFAKLFVAKSDWLCVWW